MIGISACIGRGGSHKAVQLINLDLAEREIAVTSDDAELRILNAGGDQGVLHGVGLTVGQNNGGGLHEDITRGTVLGLDVVVGDLAGFASSVYMRGIDFYNVPTTLLSQVDASVGGKTAINLCGVKNTVGAFKQPKAVLVDVGVLETLPKRHMRNGMAEVIKMAAVANEKLFAALENSSEEDTYNNIADIITEAVKIKRDIVEADEKESGLRKILNFGHTLGHAIEESERCDRLHGECVAIGMIPVSLADAKNRISSLLRKYSLPTSHDVDSELISRGIAHDKKAKGDKISIIFCPQIGKYCIKNMTVEEFTSIIE